jgi:hypothetical protein
LEGDVEKEINAEKSEITRISTQPSPVQILTHKKQPHNVNYFRYLDSRIINNASSTRDMKSRTVMAEETSNKKKALSLHQIGYKFQI